MASPQNSQGLPLPLPAHRRAESGATPPPGSLSVFLRVPVISLISSVLAAIPRPDTLPADWQPHENPVPPPIAGWVATGHWRTAKLVTVIVAGGSQMDSFCR